MMQEKKAEILVRVKVPLAKAGNARKQREDKTSSSKALPQHSNPYLPKDLCLTDLGALRVERDTQFDKPSLRASNPCCTSECKQ